MHSWKVLAVVLLLIAAGGGPAAADIYRYVDEEGTVHFTDVPTDRRFKIFMREVRKDRQLRTTFRLSGYARNPAEFDEIINTTIMSELTDEYILRSKPLSITDVANQIQAIALASALIVVTLNLLADLAILVLDPRTRSA